MPDEPEFTLGQQATIDKAIAEAKKSGKDSMAKKYSDYDETKAKLAEIEAKRQAEVDKGKTEMEKLQSTLDEQNKGIKALGDEMKTLKAFKADADLQGVIAERCKTLSLDPKYARYATGETEEEIDASLKQIHADFQPKTLGAGGGGGDPEGDSGVSNKAINNFIRGA